MNMPARSRCMIVGGAMAAGLAACDPPRPSAAAVDPSLAQHAILDDIGADSTGRDSVLAEIRRYYRDFSTRDWDAFAGHFWPGAILTTVWQPPGEAKQRVETLTIPQFVAQAPEGPGSKPIFEERMDSARVRLMGNLAHVWAFYTARFGDSVSVMTWRGIDAFTLMQHDGGWRIVSLAYTDLPSDSGGQR